MSKTTLFARTLTIMALALNLLTIRASSQSEEKQARKPKAQYVLLVSIDGLSSDAITALGPKGAPYLHQIINEGASTLNARTDPDFTNTLPNHISMLTGRPVRGQYGHAYTLNKTTTKNIHGMRGRFVSSVFDVVHNANLTTAFIVAKRKFAVFATSYGTQHIRVREGTKKYFGSESIDIFKISRYNDAALFDFFKRAYIKNTPAFTFLHLSGPDNVGHDFNWDVRRNSIYLNEVKRTDALIGELLQLIRSHPQLNDNTIVIITSDHGGVGYTHQDIYNRLNYTVPFLIWGKDVRKGADLYALNKTTRNDPDTGQVDYTVEGQPIRNGDAANLILSILDLPPVPESTINNRQDLRY